MAWLIRSVIAVVLGAVVGIGSALWMAGLTSFTPPISFQNVVVDGWHSDWTIGSEAADPYTRARVARHGLLALTKEEAVYFVRPTDDAGQPLRDSCNYLMSGGDFPAEWWSITLYDRDSRLPMNGGRAMSIDATRVEDRNDWSVTVSVDGPFSGNWISSRNAGQFDLMLRLYRPSAALVEDPGAVLVPPTVEAIGCGSAS